jgi:hypothetical protein
MMIAHEVRQPCYNSSEAFILPKIHVIFSLAGMVEKVRKSVFRVRRT